jgi:hypothetical protein
MMWDWISASAPWAAVFLAGGTMGASCVLLCCSESDEDVKRHDMRERLISAERRRTQTLLAEMRQLHSAVERQWNRIAQDYELALLQAWHGLKAPASWRKKTLAEFEALPVVQRAIMKPVSVEDMQNA